MTRTAGWVHKWLALVLTIPILFWFGSGLFFAIAPIEQVRGEHVKAAPAAVPIAFDAAASGLGRLAGSAAPGDRIEIKTMGERQVAVVSSGKARPRLYDLASGRLMSPITADEAVAVARRDVVDAPDPAGVHAVTSASPTYRGVLPAWRVDFVTDTRRSIYVAADTGAVTARRSTLWRVYDFLWGLHILDFGEHEDFNTVLLAVATALGLVLLITGVVLLPSRLGLRWRQGRN